MQAKSPPRMQVVKREDKQAKLTAFILEQIDRIEGAVLSDGSYELQLVAVSAASPVIAALKDAAAERDLSQVHLRLILANVSGPDLIEDLAGLPRVSVNWARNGRLLDAHEQLVISETACWTGDCMRREPNKRDAFECFADDCRESASWARTSFERLWGASVSLLVASDAQMPAPTPKLPMPVHPADADARPIVGTRH